MRTISSSTRPRTKQSPRWPSRSRHSRGQTSHCTRPSGRLCQYLVGKVAGAPPLTPYTVDPLGVARIGHVSTTLVPRNDTVLPRSRAVGAGLSRQIAANWGCGERAYPLGSLVGLEGDGVRGDGHLRLVRDRLDLACLASESGPQLLAACGARPVEGWLGLGSVP